MSALEDPEDGLPNEIPTAPFSTPPRPEPFREPLPSAADTVRPPPLDFSRFTDSEKLTWLCTTVEHISDAQIQISQNVAVLNARIGVVDGEDGGPSIYKQVRDLAERFEQTVGPMSLDVEAIRTHLLGKGASIHDLQRAEEARRPAVATTDRPTR